jgi:polyhydroxyalkanoate synthase
MMQDEAKLANFLRMEKWKADMPDQAGEMFRKYIKDLWQGNKLIKGEFELGGHIVDLKNMTVPFLNIFATEDNIIPNASTAPVMKAVGSKDKEEYAFPGGHIGVFVGAKSQKELGTEGSSSGLRANRNCTVNARYSLKCAMVPFQATTTVLR